jgi:hypothetical protein
MDIFDNEFDDSSSFNGELEKALEAGYGTDAANFTQGRALQREDLEATLVSVLDVKQNDCKVFHKLHKQPVSSTVHQVNRQTSVGDDEFLFVGEGDLATEDDPVFQRKIYETKYMSSKWQVSHPLSLTNNAENPINASKVSAVLRVTKGTERAIFHGDSSVSPKQYDGLIKILKDSAANTDVEDRLRATRVDIRGLEIGEKNSTIDAGEELFDELSERVLLKGGDLNEAYFPPILASQFKRMFTDRLRFTTKDSQFTMDKLPDIVTAANQTIKITDDCGVDKMFKVKGPVVASGDMSKRPNTPSNLTATPSTASDSNFTDGFAGDYTYAVHAVNAFGISAPKVISAPVSVAVGEKVTLTITPDTNGNAATGYIITRTNAGGTTLMEMVRIPKKGETTTYEDLNNDLPGTAQVVLLTSTTDDLAQNLSFAQLMGISNFDLPTDSSLAHRGVVALYGTLEVRAPEFCALIDNVGYKGGLY